MAATVIRLRRPRADVPAELPPEAVALAALLAAIPDPVLRDWCAAQLRSAASPGEVGDALALAQALGRDAGPAAARAAEPPALRLAVGAPLPADIGQGPAGARRGSLSAQRKRKLPCIATSSSP